MLYALEHPLSLLVLLASFLLSVTVHGLLQSALAVRTGDVLPRQQRRLSADPRHHLDPFGAVAAALSGLGWGLPLEPRRRSRGALLAVHLLPPLLGAGLGVLLLVGWRVAYGPLSGDVGGFAFVLQRGLPASLSDLGSLALLLGGASQLYLGVLHLVPLPPLDGGRLLLGLAPRSPGWQKAEYYLVERNLGVVALLVLLLLPLGGSVPPLPALLDIVLGPLIQLLLGV